MAERATVFETTQVGVESVSGTVVPAYKRLLAVEIAPKPMVPTVALRNMGSKFTTATFNKKEWTQGDMKGEACYKTLSYLFSSILTTETITTPGGGTLSRNWSYQPNAYSPDTPKTLTIESGSSAGAERFPFGCLDSFALRYTKDEVGVSGTWFGQALVESITLTPNLYQVTNVDVGTSTGGTFTLTVGGQTTTALAWNITKVNLQAALVLLSSIGTGGVVVTGADGGQAGTPFILTFALNNTGPITVTGSGVSLTGVGHALNIVSATAGIAVTDITPVPIDPTQLEFLVSTDGSSYTLLTRVFEAEFSINNRFSQVITLDDSTQTFSAVVEKAIQMAMTLVLEHNAVAAGYMSNLRNKTELWMRLLATGPIIEGSIHYLMQIDFPFHFKDNSRGDKGDVWASTYHLEPIYDATWNGGAALKVQLVNNLTAL